MAETITYDVKVVKNGCANVRRTTVADGVESNFRYVIDADDTSMTGQPQEVIDAVTAQRAQLS